MEIPEKVCALPLGMENKKIPDSAIVASSRYRQYSSDYYGPEQGRLNNQGKCFLSLDVIDFATKLRRLQFKKNRPSNFIHEALNFQFDDTLSQVRSHDRERRP